MPEGELRDGAPNLHPALRYGDRAAATYPSGYDPKRPATEGLYIEAHSRQPPLSRAPACRHPRGSNTVGPTSYAVRASLTTDCGRACRTREGR